ncbi:MAG: RDD family protein [Acidimicrobiales bacterium]
MTRDPRRVLGRRVGAYAIDALIGFGISLILFFALAERIDKPPLLDGDLACDLIESSESASLCFAGGDTLYYATDSQAALIFLIPVGYWFLLNGIVQGLTGATIGKAILGLRVVDEQGAICGIPKALGRTIVGIVDSLPTAMGVGFLVAVNRSDRRRLGDMAARTNVVRSYDVGSPPNVAVSQPTTWTPPPPGQGMGQTPPPPGQGMGQTPPPTQMPAPSSPPAPTQSGDVPAGAEDGPVWDAARGRYVQIQAGSGRLLEFDDATQSWRPAN